MGGIRRAVHEWWKAERLDDRPVAERKRLALRLFEEPLGDDKLAGVLALREMLVGHLGRRDVPALGRLFAEGHVADWNTCDWLCVKVLGPMIETGGRPVARAFAAWGRAEGLWQRRASCVAFVNLARRGEANFPGFTPLLLRSCERLVRSPERFAQTGVGWTLRELSRIDRDGVAAFLRRHASRMSLEAVRSAVATMPRALASELLALRRP
jgi:3-methyladenine DNA glycosylase AlkD